MSAQLQKTPIKVFDAIVPFLVVVIFAGVIAPFFYYVIQPALQNYLPGGSMNYTSAKQLLDARTGYRDTLRGLEEFVSGAEKNQQDPLNLVLPKGADAPTLYALFEKLAADQSVGLQAIDISATREEEMGSSSAIRKVPVALRFVNVPYERLKLLVRALETNMRLTTVESLNYDPVNQTASVNVVTYYFSE